MIEKLDYLRDLGVGAIYLNPIFLAATNHRYDTADYWTIDPLLGDFNVYRRLIEEAKKRSIHVILDGVFNHMSADSPAFDLYRRWSSIGACESPDSTYRDWFIFPHQKHAGSSPNLAPVRDKKRGDTKSPLCVIGPVSARSHVKVRVGAA